MSPLAALLVLLEQGSRRQLREILEGCAGGCGDRPPMFRRTERPS